MRSYLAETSFVLLANSIWSEKTVYRLLLAIKYSKPGLT